MDETKIIKDVLAGNKESYKTLVQNYSQRIFAYIYRFIGNDKESAQDITQEVFLKAYENLAGFDFKKSFSPWLYRIAHNEAVNFIKKNSRRKEILLDEDHWNDIGSSETSVTDQIDNANNANLVYIALNKIKPKFREVIVLHYFEEKSYEEIAKIINKPRNTVGILMMRGKKHLKRLLEQLK